MNSTDLNFFLDVEGARALMAKEYRYVSRKDIQFTIDLVEEPTRLIFTQDAYVHMVKRVLRSEIGFDKYGDGGILNALIIVEKPSGKAHTIAPTRDTEEYMEMLFQLCMRVMMCVVDYKLDEVSKTMNMQEEGIVIFNDRGKLRLGRVSHKDRPNLSYIDEHNNVVVGRPYWDEVREKLEAEL